MPPLTVGGGIAVAAASTATTKVSIAFLPISRNGYQRQGGAATTTRYVGERLDGKQG